MFRRSKVAWPGGLFCYPVTGVIVTAVGALTLLLIAVALLRGSSYLPTLWALEDLSPVAVACIEVLVASAAVLALLAARRADRAETIRLVRSRPLPVVLLGLTQIALPLLLVAVALRSVPSGVTAVLIAATPLFIATAGLLPGNPARPSAIQVGGLALGLIGVALVAGVGSGGPSIDLLGGLAALGAAAAYAAGALSVRRWFARTPPVAVGAVSVLGSLPLVAAVAVFAVPAHAPGARAIGALVALGIGGVLCAVILFVLLVQRAGPERALLVTYLNPAVALGLAVSVQHEVVTLRAIAGLGLILLGVAAGAQAPRPRRVARIGSAAVSHE
jgi:drug/metabolite transporter (DMT)-like permease